MIAVSHTVKLTTRPGVSILRSLICDQLIGCVVYENRAGCYCWVPPPRSLTILNPEVDRWLRDNVGPRHGETFVIDRVYYPGEVLPELPPGWKATAALHPEGERWTVRSIGFRNDTVFFDTMESAVLFRMRWNGELIEW